MTKSGFLAFCLSGLVLVSGCTSQAVRDAEQAEAELQLLVKAPHTLGERCDAEKRVAQAWLKTRDQGKYGLANSTANLACLRAERLGPSYVE